MSKNRLGVALLGCGNIASPYAVDLPNFAHLKLVGVFDLIPERAQALAEKCACRAYTSLKELLADPDMDIVANLTIFEAHYQTTRRVLEAGKHVYSEKPLAMRHEEAQELVDLARSRGLRLSCSPFTLMGEAQQTAWKWIREGRLGQVRLVYAEVNHGRIETWHPSPQPFYAVGPLYDVGVYPLAILTGMFGPARSVSAYSTVLMPRRQAKSGAPFAVAAPDFTVANIEFAGEKAPLVRLTANFYVSEKIQPERIEFHGDQGSLYLKSWFAPDSDLLYAPFNEDYALVAPARQPSGQVHWAAGISELAQAILEGRPHRNSAEQAAHVVEILNAAQSSAETGLRVEIHSTFESPAPMDWAK